ncbi:MAG: hypothetical protein ACR2G6_09220 [Gemmatimonadaceae bacterium]
MADRVDRRDFVRIAAKWGAAATVGGWSPTVTRFTAASLPPSAATTPPES